jgi:hypothetical protein
MNVVAFALKQFQRDGTWQTSELSTMQYTFAAEVANGDASGWATAATEIGDPQFYLLGPRPDEDCILSISRIGRVYVLEDGVGHIVCEDASLERLADQAKAYLRGTRGALMARLVLLWAAVRQTFEEKIEPVLAEGEEFLVHVAPQLAAVV